MRVYPINDAGEKLIKLECTDFLCKYSFDSVTTHIWQDENYKYDRFCRKCKSVLIETMDNWVPMPTID